MKAIEQPVYDNSDLSSSDAWLLNNLRPFFTYMDQIGAFDRFDHNEIRELAKIQYDRQVLLDRAEFELQLSYQLAQVAQ